MIALDIGNSRVKFGLFAEGAKPSSGDLPACLAFIAVSLDVPVFPWEQIEGQFRQANATGNQSSTVLASSVNATGLERILSEWPSSYWPRPSLVVNSDLPIVNRTRYPEKVGTDRLLKGVAANVIRNPDLPIAVVDSGTATTIDWINETGEFCGGAILPGMELASRALHLYTDQLPPVNVREIAVYPEAIGQETSAALRSGLFWGQVGAVRELIRQMAIERNQPWPKVLITGGGGELLTTTLENASYRPTLTLEGLAVANGVRSGKS